MSHDLGCGNLFERFWEMENRSVSIACLVQRVEPSFILGQKSHQEICSISLKTRQ
jgi:hypothetical protein